MVISQTFLEQNFLQNDSYLIKFSQTCWSEDIFSQQSISTALLCRYRMLSSQSANQAKYLQHSGTQRTTNHGTVPLTIRRAVIGYLWILLLAVLASPRQNKEARGMLQQPFLFSFPQWLFACLFLLGIEFLQQLGPSTLHLQIIFSLHAYKYKQRALFWDCDGLFYQVIFVD